MRIYFSADHNYTPVRYEYMRGELADLIFEVQSLEKVGEGLWFPSSGVIYVAGQERVNAFKTTSKILVNQGLTDKNFDIEFPPGTRVADEIKNTEYVVSPAGG
jgi:hypothetical protein